MIHPDNPLRLLFATCLAANISAGCLGDGAVDRSAPEPEPIPLPPPVGARLGLPSARVDGLFVMSWNLENFPRSPETIDTVVRLLDQYQPDVVAVQEIAEVEAFQALIDALPGYEGILNDDEGAAQRVGVLVRSERVSVGATETLFIGDWYSFPRPPLRVAMTWRNQRGAVFDFSFVSLHLKAMTDEDSQYRRRLACEKLDKWMEQELLLPGADPDIIIAGDWNDAITDPAKDNVFQALLDKPERYRFLTAELEGKNVYSYVPFKSLIDHVMVTVDALTEYGKGSIAVLPLDLQDPYYCSVVSDHRPLLSRFQVPMQ